MASSGTPKKYVNTTALDTSVAGIYEKLFPPVHVVDGPCVKTAPFDHKFVEPYQAKDLVTCAACKVFMALEDGEQGTTYARYSRITVPR